MTTMLTDEGPARGFVRFRLTVKQYHRMLKSGIIRSGAPYELLDGEIVHKDRSARGEDPMTIGIEHAYVVIGLSQLSGQFARHGCHVRAQQPLSIPPDHEPEPDGAIVVGEKDDYLKEHPSPADVLCAVEVADSSLRLDRTTKLRIYANAGIPMYVILVLADRTAEVYTGPLVGEGRYEHVRVLGIKERLSFPTAGGKAVVVPLAKLFPKAQ